MAKCAKSIQHPTSISRVQDSTQPITRATRSTQGAINKGSEQDFYSQTAKRYLHGAVRSTARAHQGLRASLKGAACLVAAAIGIAMSMPMAVAPAAQKMPIKSVKQYAKEFTPNKTQWKCLAILWGKESAWNHLADNPHSTAFGIPQILGLKTIDPYEQIDRGIKYINHRYDGDACKAWKHHQRRGWY
jgi:hypothetical protein